MCKPREEGGLGLRDIQNFNTALLAKWKWRLIAEEKGRWKEMVVSKYGLGSEVSRIPVKLQSWWWRDLAKACGEGGDEGWFQKEVGWKLGRGDKVRFWEDIWVGNSSLKTLFPRLYSLSSNQGQKVEEVGRWDDEVWRWNLRWIRARFEWESKLEEEMLTFLSTTSLRREKKDGHTWGSEDERCFSVKFAYACLANQGRGPHLEVFKLLWKAKAFPNMVTTAWRALTDSLPTRERLSRKGTILNNTLCALCQTTAESSQHLFMECKHTLCVWSMCFRWFGIVLAKHNDIKINFESFHLFQVNSKQYLVWKGVWTAIVRSI